VTKSYLTAITRKTLPVPVRWLIKNNLIHGEVLDFGCGKCQKINDRVLAKTPGVEWVISYDPYFQPILFNNLKFDVILCTYVLCILPFEEEKTILKEIQNRLKPDGFAYITVRNDTPKRGYGVCSFRETLQRKVSIPYLLLFRSCPQYNMYLLTAYNHLQ
jgi:SAM-dependent methyltransferase